MKRTIIITGGTTGIGKATAYQFAKNGWNVVITSRSEKKGNAFIEEAKNEGLEMTFFQLDVTNEEQVAQVIEQTVAKFGKLDSIVNNSGISLGAAPLADTETDEFKQQLDTNVLGVYYGMKYAIRAMLKTGWHDSQFGLYRRTQRTDLHRTILRHKARRGRTHQGCSHRLRPTGYPYQRRCSRCYQDRHPEARH